MNAGGCFVVMVWAKGAVATWLGAVLLPMISAQGLARSTAPICDSDLSQMVETVINPACCGSRCDGVPQQCSRECADVFNTFYEQCVPTMASIPADMCGRLGMLYGNCQQHSTAKGFIRPSRSPFSAPVLVI
eukprot:SAG11_NODE_18572_length_487_cov_0.682990_1_plen_131_part_10